MTDIFSIAYFVKILLSGRELAKYNLASLFKTPSYYPHHFILLTNFQGQVTVIEEARHIETLWKKDKDGQWNKSLESKVRIYYMIKNSYHRANALLRVFRTRKTLSERSLKKPGLDEQLQKPYWQANKLKIFGNTIVLLILKLLLQPYSIFTDTSLDIKVHNWYWEMLSGRSAFKRLFRFNNDEIFDLSIPSRGQYMLEGRITPSALESMIRLKTAFGQSAQFKAKDFRIFHVLEFGDISVANLDIADEAFLKLIQLEIDSVREVEDNLVNFEQSFAMEIKQALKQWRVKNHTLFDDDYNQVNYA